MSVFQSCSDIKDSVELLRSQGLYLKQTSKLHVSVHLPTSQLPGKTISNWEVMEKLKHMIKPDEFWVLKVSKSTLEFIRFDGEIEHRSRLLDVIKKLDLRSLKLAGFPEALKIRAAEAKVDFPTRHTWDSFFRDAKNMNEMKAGERPDTLHISNLPCKWFVDKRNKHKGNDDKPDEYIFRKVFEVFGEVRCVDVPICDPYRNKMKAHISGIKMFSFGQDSLFEGYVQYKEYMSFVRAMDALRGMKLLMKDGDKIFSATIKVEFDKTKHLGDTSIRRRKIERDKLIAIDREMEEKDRIQQELEEKRRMEEKCELEALEKSKAERRKKREEKRKEKQLKKMHAKEAEKMNKKIATEERKLLMAQRQLESIRLLDYLFERIKVKKQQELLKKQEEEEEKSLKEDKRRKKKKKEKKRKKKEKKDKVKKEKLVDKEKELRSKLVKNQKTVQENELEQQREKLRKAVEGKNKLRSVLAATCAKVNKPTEEKTSNTTNPSSVMPDGNFPGNRQGASNGYPGGPQWFPMPPGGYGYYESMQGFPSSCSSFGFPNPGFPPRGGFFPRRQRGYRRPRGFRRGGWVPPNYYDVNQEYYKYFKNLTRDKNSKRSRSRSWHASSRSQTRSRSRSRSRNRSRGGSRSRSRSRDSESRNRSRSRSRRRSRSGSKERSRSRRHSRSESKRRSRSASKSRSRSRNARHSRTRSKTRSRSRDLSKSKNRYKRPSPRGSHRNRSKSKSKNHSKKSGTRESSRSRSRPPDKGSPPSRSRSPHRSKESTSPAAVPRSRTKSRSSSNEKSSRSWSRHHSRSRSSSKISSKFPLNVDTTENEKPKIVSVINAIDR